MHQNDLSALDITFAVANLIIAAGYVSVPFLVLRYLPLTRTVLLWGAGFLLGGAGTRLALALLVSGDGAGLFWTLEHVFEAICAWGFVLTFHRMLRAANQRRTRAGGGEVR